MELCAKRLLFHVRNHSVAPVVLDRGADLLMRMSTGVLSKGSSETVRNHRNAVRDASE
jgi:hypothetical protein